MPENLTMGLFVFGAVLILVSLLGGGFNIFSFAVSTTISSPLIRITSFVIGAASILLALNPDLPFHPPAESTNTSLPVATQSLPATLQITQTSVQPAQPDLPTPTSTSVPIAFDPPVPQQPSATDFVISYWQNVSDGRYENAWAQLSPRFRQTMHNNDFNDYLRGYQEMNLCRIAVSNVNLVRQDLYSAVVTAHFIYYTSTQCDPSEYDFEMWLIADASNSWLFDRNTIK